MPACASLGVEQHLPQPHAPPEPQIAPNSKPWSAKRVGKDSNSKHYLSLPGVRRVHGESTFAPTELQRPSFCNTHVSSALEVQFEYDLGCRLLLPFRVLGLAFSTFQTFWVLPLSSRFSLGLPHAPFYGFSGLSKHGPRRDRQSDLDVRVACLTPRRAHATRAQGFLIPQF